MVMAVRAAWLRSIGVGSEGEQPGRWLGAAAGDGKDSRLRAEARPRRTGMCMATEGKRRCGLRQNRSRVGDPNEECGQAKLDGFILILVGLSWAWAPRYTSEGC